MTYQETCNYLFTKTPMFERQGVSGYKEGLENTFVLDEHFGHPHKDFRSIHIAGTNGKGSCAHTIAAILQQCGYKVGLYTSPHLVDFRERIRINGQPIPENYVVDFVENERNFFEPLQPTFFELTTAMAFKYFSEMQVDIAVIEVGLGGRLDCTNIITPILSVITNISLDHTQLLGDSLEQIAMEKAGIIKSGVPVVIGEARPETRPVFEAMAEENKAPIIFAEDIPEMLHAELQLSEMVYETRSYGTITGELCGRYQAKNANTILWVIRKLEDFGYMYRYTDDSKSPTKGLEVKAGFKNVCATTGLMGRWQVISKSPTVVCDTGHNPAGWEYLSRQLNEVECKNMYIVFGVVEDKDVDSIMALLPKRASYFFTKASSKRALSERVLQMMGQQLGLSGNVYPSVAEAYAAAKIIAKEGDFVFIGGSSYVVADFLKNCL
ncbi:MAG: bifunctional folylpolyglutamate synthase/dihydrofolate synthase [Prevotella sp.]|nr:bifunctional folylpolyglutamate synthase/dihydrofolate synthase [Prevotella sp.]